MKLWNHPSNYIGATWEGWYVFLGQNRDSDCLTRSNFRCALKAVKAAMDNTLTADDDMATVQVVRENHWAWGWIEWIAIYSSDKAAIAEAERIEERLESYPVVSENDWSELEMEEANEVWRNCYRPAERIQYVREHRNQFDFRDLRDMLACIRGQYFAGYASELLN